MATNAFGLLCTSQICLSTRVRESGGQIKANYPRTLDFELCTGQASNKAVSQAQFASVSDSFWIDFIYASADSGSAPHRIPWAFESALRSMDLAKRRNFIVKTKLNDLTL